MLLISRSRNLTAKPPKKSSASNCIFIFIRTFNQTRTAAYEYGYLKVQPHKLEVSAQRGTIGAKRVMSLDTDEVRHTFFSQEHPPPHTPPLLSPRPPHLYEALLNRNPRTKLAKTSLPHKKPGFQSNCVSPTRPRSCLRHPDPTPRSLKA